jgi:aryl-alcohol dehydrogenase-like predicted oxidoreductase
MEHRTLGSSEVNVSRIIMGLLTVGGNKENGFAVLGTTDLTGLRRQLDMCLAAGVDTFDVANVYSGGAAETILGQALGDRRQSVVLATKAGYPKGTGPRDSGTSRAHLIAECHASLRRLNTDYIDLFQVHVPDARTPISETVEALQELQRLGMIRAYGLSNFQAHHITDATWTARTRGAAAVASHQAQYSLLHRDIEHSALPAAIEAGVATIAYSPLARGWLTGKYTDAHQPNPLATPPVRNPDQLADILDALHKVANEARTTLAQAALAWVLDRPGVDALIVGARDEAQLADNLAAADIKLTRDHHNLLTAASVPSLPYPVDYLLSHVPNHLSHTEHELYGR